MNQQPDQSEFTAAPAEREAAPVTACIVGQSGTGKTYSALLFARGMVGKDGKIVVIDTEGKRALIYADDPQIGGFSHVDFKPPYSSRRFQECINSQVQAGFDAIIIDSASHEHEAEGGMLDFADHEEYRINQAPNPQRVSQRKWIKPKAEHNRYMRAVLSSPAHIIFCCREKKIVDVNAKPPKEILEPVCEKNFMFEMMIVMRLDQEHRAHFTKVPEPFKAHIRDGDILTVEHGQMFMQEAGRGKVKSDDDNRLAQQLRELTEIAQNNGHDAVAAAWGAMPKSDRAALQHELPRLRETAANTDDRIASEAASEKSQEHDHGPLMDVDPRDEVEF